MEPILKNLQAHEYYEPEEGANRAMHDPHVVTVEIRGQRYPIRSSLDAQYVTGLAVYVDEKMKAAAESTPSGDSLRLAVLAALNIADELFRCQDAQHARRGALSERYEALERLVDAALEA